MITNIKTLHEEGYSDGSKTLGVLLNYSEDNGITFKESFTYIYIEKDNMYIFFNTMFDLFEYLLYGKTSAKRAYMEEDVFDSYYDAPYIEGKFNDILQWV